MCGFQCSLACKYVGTFSIAFWACIHACRRGCFRFRLFKGGGTHVRVRKAAWVVHRGGKVCVLSASFFASGNARFQCVACSHGRGFWLERDYTSRCPPQSSRPVMFPALLSGREVLVEIGARRGGSATQGSEVRWGAARRRRHF